MCPTAMATVPSFTSSTAASIAWYRVALLDPFKLGRIPGQGVFTPTTADDEYGHNIFLPLRRKEKRMD